MRRRGRCRVTAVHSRCLLLSIISRELAAFPLTPYSITEERALMTRILLRIDLAGKEQVESPSVCN